MTLRYYQSDAIDELDDGWSRFRAQMLRMGTGTGKSKTAACVLRDNIGGGLMMAHRREIVSQLSLALATEGVRHRVIGPDDLMRLCMQQQIKKLGTHYITPGSPVGVASTDSLKVLKGEEAFLSQVTMAVCDEAHHYLRENAFGKAVARLRPTCRLLMPTATPRRTDGLGLGLHAHGFAEHMVLGPAESKMMYEGWLCKYKIFAPPTTFHRENLHLGASDEFKKDEVKKEVAKSTVFGDAVKHYTQNVMGLTALAFVDSLENANALCVKFRAAGVKAEVLSGTTESGHRTRTLELFDQGKIDLIISVSLIDEGFDCPNVRVVLDCAPTTSIIRYRQRFGRGWRPADGKDFFYYFDFVGNVMQHGLPDAYCDWNLNGRSPRGSNTVKDEIPVRVCDNAECGLVYERIHATCPYCAHKPLITQRNGPKFVDGILQELDEETLRLMRGEIARIDGAPPAFGGYAISTAVARNHRETQRAQAELRYATALYGGWQAALGRPETEGQSRFFYRYSIDLNSAWALKAEEARNLRDKIMLDLQRNNVTDSTTGV